jgi:hypothetical protein
VVTEVLVDVTTESADVLIVTVELAYKLLAVHCRSREPGGSSSALTVLVEIGVVVVADAV